MTTYRDKKIIPDMSTPEGIKEAIEHIQAHKDEGAGDMVRIINLEILRILEEAEVEDAVVLEEELRGTTTSSGEAIHADVSSVADDYTDQQGETINGDLHIDLKRTAGVGYAVSAVTAAVLAGSAGHGEQGRVAIEDARQTLQGIGDSEEAAVAKLELGGIMDNVVDALPVAEQ